VLLLSCRCAETATDVDLADLVPRSAQGADRLDRTEEGPLEAGEAVGQPAGSSMEVDRVDRQVVPARRSERVLEPFEPDAELRRPVARVVEVLVVPGAGPGIDADPDRGPGRPTAVSLDLADRVEVHVDAVPEDHVEVAVRDVGARVADLVGAPAVLQSAFHLARRARIDADAVRGAGPAETAKHCEDLGERVGLEGEADDMRPVRPGESGLQPARVLGEALPVIDEERRPVSAGKVLCVLPADAQPPILDVEARADPPGRGGQDHRRRRDRKGRGGRQAWICARRAEAVQRSGPSSTSTPIAPSRRSDAAAISAMAASNASLFRAEGTR
jgi:hypothetical protein